MNQTQVQMKGVLIHGSTIEGQTRYDGIYPAHADAIQVSSNRWMILYSNRGFMGDDNYKSLVYQIRRDSLDGPLVREGILEKSRSFQLDHDESTTYSTQLGSPHMFGVPKGLEKLHPAGNANIFVARWYIRHNLLRRASEGTLKLSANRILPGIRSSGVQWVQYKLNESEDDIEIIQAPSMFTQKGFEESDSFCELGPDITMNHGFSRPFPLNDDQTHWCDVITAGGIAPVKFEFNPSMGKYEWTEVGTRIGDADYSLGEPSIVQVNDSFIIAARTGERGWNKPNWKMKKGTIAWVRLDDPFSYNSYEIIYPEDARNGRAAPFTLAKMADEGLRVFSNDDYNSPYPELNRNPLYVWDIDPGQGFQRMNRQVVYDGVALQLPGAPNANFVHLVTHSGGDKQFFTFFESHKLTTPISDQVRQLYPREEEANVYYGAIQFDRECPSEWGFNG